MKLALYGYGGHAKEVAAQIDQPIDFFVDDEFVNENTKPISKFNVNEYNIMIAISDCFEREKIVNRLPPETRYFTFIHPSVKIFDKNFQIGKGSFIGANSIITTNVKIGKHAIINRGNQIGHDCIIGDYFSMMPGAILSGNVNVGNRVYMGTNSTIIEKKFISSDVIIGANAVVIDNIDFRGTFVGVPAKKVKDVVN